MESSWLEMCGALLAEKKLSIAFAESATAGAASARFSLLPDAGEILKGGFVCNDAGLKSSVLQVSPELIQKYTPESQKVTEAIARGLKTLIPASIHIGITGLTKPGGSETAEKRVGTMFVTALKGEDLLFSERLGLLGSPSAVITQTVEKVAQLLYWVLKN
ncbi:CinA family protein [Niabella terrae]